MKKIECIIRPEKLEEVKDALDKCGVRGLTVTQVMGCGQQKGYTEVYRGVELNINLLPKIRIEIVAKDSDVDKIVETVIKAARSGKIGDGKIFVYGIDEAIRIRTGEKGDTVI